MKILWTRSPNIVDWLIELVTGEDCAHLALFFPTKYGGGIVFESNLLGCRPAFFKTWMKKGRRTIVHELELPVSEDQANALWDQWVALFDGQPYDFGGVFYLGWWKFKHRLFGTPRPAKNPWAKRTAFFCDEIFQLVAAIPGINPSITYHANGMATPHDVWTTLRPNQ
jgi:hypothetical protein